MSGVSISRGSGLRLCEYLHRIDFEGVGWLHWPCVQGRRPRPNGIDAPHSARDEGLRQTEFDSQGRSFYRYGNDLWFRWPKLLVCAGRIEFGVGGEWEF